jgi:predicted nucleic-acid-binding protein
VPLIVVLGSKFVGRNEIVYWVVYLDGSYLSVGLKSFKNTDVTKLRMKITNWKDCIRNRNEWKKLVEKAKTFSKL